MGSLRCRQILVFAVGWMGYASTYFLRKPLGVLKPDLQNNLGFTTTQLGWLDTALLLPYAVMQMALGPVGDKFGARRTFGFALVCSGLSMIFFGNFTNFYAFFVLLFLNGTAQAMCWPNCTKGLLCWFSDGVRHSISGIFGTCCFAGGIIGTMLAVYIQSTAGWEMVCFYPSLFVIFMGCMVMLLYHGPHEVGMDVPGKETSAPPPKKDGDEQAPKLRLIDMWRMQMIPEISVALFCLKVVRYCMYMWLPMYLLKSLNYTQSTAGLFSTVFEVGGVIGSPMIGFALDRYYKGQTMRGIALFVFISALGLVGFIITASWGMMFNGICLFIAGAFNAGPDILLGGSVPTEIVEKHNKQSASAAMGLVNGFGSIGTCIQGPVIGLVAAHVGWSGMFYMMIGLAAIGTASMYRAAWIWNKVNAGTPDYINNSV